MREKNKIDDAKQEITKLHTTPREGVSIEIIPTTSMVVVFGHCNPPYESFENGGVTYALARAIHMLPIY